MKNSRRVFFKPKEDQMILKLKAKYPNSSWSFIAKKIKGKTAKQCNDRYNKHLRQEKNKSPWTEEEDERLAQLVDKHGHNWVVISKVMGTRTNIEAKNRWSVIERRKKKTHEDEEKIKDENGNVLEEILMSSHYHEQLMAFDKDDLIDRIYEGSIQKKDDLGFDSFNM